MRAVTEKTKMYALTFLFFKERNLPNDSHSTSKHESGCYAQHKRDQN
ncbi:hypothetical protein BSI_30730 [Bacillus inaquosorum KCTC 13429]|uniref:Uncharacterized protein n=1 Tax=Bacillus inaquosorum KCTC 13429 TaxID=1236548 RepID=A0A9W5LH74_9BACI|nr:hypothetical protein BSI_30730 [Bacillus inaquosorum KCTC 13429]